ncbi:hypothetical protein PLESTB_001574200 [Pleodorina starrii]|uniref:Bax inhibitor-1/YccA family protein n=1 Tax=Pleodorina starrii TaxID=330485 RepID=A0A9W6F883_9CHLO|nr:hypothetical protein PLESTM_000879600 [Pleodorina starrii]GLC60102.1 hypothetical protein PLESTB_001574200 [Pleodorina starrii]GLC68997.1 hypothetical protein PLESTF_000767800 [Pleodorina starrii]
MLVVKPIGAGTFAGRRDVATRPAVRLPTPIPQAPGRQVHVGPIPARGAVVARIMTSTSSNPAFTFGKVDEALSESRRGGPPMTVDGAVQKTGLLLAVAVASAVATWVQIASGNAAAMLAASKGAGVVALISAFATMFKPQWSMGTSLVFSAAQGVAMAGMSVFLEMLYPGIVLNALMLTFGTAASLLVAFQARLIRVTDKFRDGVLMVTGGYFAAMLLGWVMSLFGVKLPSMLSAGPLGIGLGLVAASLAAANLLLDFDMIRSASRARMPKWFEWYGAFSLMMTLVWMYTEVLRLLTMFARGNSDN